MARPAVPVLDPGQVVRIVAGIRPCRRTGPRVEVERVAGKVVVHNYGHGGGGVTLSWGSGEVAAELVAAACGNATAPSGAAGIAAARGGDSGAATGLPPVAILGGGILGYSTALALALRGFTSVRIITDLEPLATTSAVAGALWSPDYLGDVAELTRAALTRELVIRSHAWFTARRDEGGWGVSELDCYVEDGAEKGGELVPPGLLPAWERVAGVDFPGGVARGERQRHALFIAPPVYLPRLVATAHARGVERTLQRLDSLKDIAALPEPVVVNALGARSAAIFPDPDLIPTRGHLVHLRPQNLGYMLLHREGYLFPREDVLLVGGTFEEGVEDPTPDPEIAAAVLAANRRFFGA